MFLPAFAPKAVLKEPETLNSKVAIPIDVLNVPVVNNLEAKVLTAVLPFEVLLYKAVLPNATF